MTTSTAPAPETVRCGCCGNLLPRRRVTELMSTEGVFICARCALWAAARLSGGGQLFRRARRGVAGLRNRRPRPHAHGDPAFRGVIPILVTTDVDRTCDYYTRVGFTLVERYDDGYLLMNAGDREIHFAADPDSPAHREMFVWAADATALWKRLAGQQLDGLGPVQDQPWGLREFVLTDPDGNRVRFGSHPPG